MCYKIWENIFMGINTIFLMEKRYEALNVVFIRC